MAFPLRPDTPEEGTTIEQLFSNRGVDITQIQFRLEKAAREEGLPFIEREKTYNSRLAQELGKWAESKGKGPQFHDAVFRACFAEGKNIGKISVLVDLARTLGLPQREAKEVLEKRAFKTLVDLDWLRSQEMSVKVVPTLIINRRSLMGAKKYETMENFMAANKVKVRNPAP